jgi:hypothetical protein
METLANIRTAVQADLTVDSSSTLFTPTIIDLNINRAYRKIAGLFDWPELEDAKKTSTVATQNYYDYPDTWRSDSIWRLEIDGLRYGEEPDGSPMSYDDYLIFKEDEPSSSEKKWANQERRYFVSPTPTTNGNYNIHVWGKMIPDTLSEGSVTIFSYHMPEVNEAIAIESVAMLKAKGGDKANEKAMISQEAKEITVMAWNKIIREQAKYEKVQPFFDVPDFFSENGGADVKDMRGKF